MTLLRFAGLFVVSVSCVPTGNAPAFDAGPTPAATPPYKPSFNIMSEAFEDTFDRPDAAEGTWAPFDSGAAKDAAVAEASAEAADGAFPALEAGPADGGPGQFVSLGTDWLPARTNAWRYENGKLCGQNAHNRGVWLNRVLPVNARIEFDAVALTDDGDLKTELWGDGRSFATSTSYTNATSYIAVLGGWKNTIHAIARINEHGPDRKEIKVDKNSDDPRQRAVVRGQTYRFKIERTDGKTVRWFVDGLEYLAFPDQAPLAGLGHDHFGFNEWEAKVCFDNVKVTPL